MELRDEVFHLRTRSDPHLIAVAADRKSLSQHGRGDFHLVGKLHLRLQSGAFHFLRKPPADIGHLKLDRGRAVRSIRLREKHPQERLEDFCNHIVWVFAGCRLLRLNARREEKHQGQQRKKQAHGFI